MKYRISHILCLTSFVIISLNSTFYLCMRTGPAKKLLIAVRSGYEEAAFCVFDTCGEVQSTLSLSDPSIWQVLKNVLRGNYAITAEALKQIFTMRKMPNSSPDQERFRVWHLKTTWATVRKMLITHCFENKKASLLKTVSLWQDFQFCFVFHEAKIANLNLYKRLLKNIQIISKKWDWQ